MSLDEVFAYGAGIYFSLPLVLVIIAVTGLITFIIMYNGDRWWGGKK